MKVGFIVEGRADEQVLRYLVGVLRRDLDMWRDVHFRKPERTSGPRGKGEILDEVGTMVSNLFVMDRCDWVFVVWDLIPCNAEHREDGEPSCKKERLHMLSKLREEDKPRTQLVCITRELEAWLLADGSALTKVVGTTTHPLRHAIADERYPEKIENPKAKIRKHFGNHHGGYDDMMHARKIIEKTSLAKLARVPSFAHLKDKLEGL
jgi:hypothetical protein